MADPRWQQIQDLFDEALQQPPEHCAAFLDAACAGDPDLRRELDSLLEAFREQGLIDDLSEALHGGLQAPLSATGADGHVGPYRLVRKLGEGGMGAVYLAVREGAGFAQQVALKLVREGRFSRERTLRFLNERQILARLHHDGIARFLDGGVADGGRPYFAMEYVEGEPITDYCDRRRLTVDDRLLLFTEVCVAVHYAHQHLVVHRDLKPSNILVTGEGEAARAKLLDFGIAKLLAEDAAAPAAVRTQTGLPVMTPAYAAPEQVRGEPVTTSADIYSLGVVLYELLAGRRPYEVIGLAPVDLARVVCEDLPPRPSSTAATAGSDGGIGGSVHAARRVRPESLHRRLSGDLDVMVMKALAKDPRRRYASAEALADDIRRHLAGFTIEARPDTLAYRFSKFVRRNRLAVTAAVLLLVSLVAGVVGTAWQARRATHALGQARQEAETNAQVTAFLVNLFEAPDPAEALGDTLTAYDLLERGTRQANTELMHQPLVRAAMLTALGQTYHAMGQDALARPLLDTARVLRGRHLGPSLELAHTLNALGLVEIMHGNTDRADSLYAEALAMQQRHPDATGADLASTRMHQASLWHETGRFEESEAAYREVVAHYRRPHAAPDRDLATSLQYLALLLQEQGRFEEARPLFAEALAIQRVLLPAPHPHLSLLLNDYGMMLQQGGDPKAAEQPLREALAMQRRLFGKAHPQLVFTLNNLATVVDDYDLDEADQLTTESLQIARSLGGPDNPLLANTLNMRAQIVHKQGDLPRAQALFEAALRASRNTYPEGHPRIGWALVGLGNVLHDAGRPGEAEPLLREGQAVLRAAFGPDHALTQRAAEGLAAVLRAQNRPAEADTLLEGDGRER